MKKETLIFGKGIIEVTLIDNIIYIKNFHLYNDEMAIEMTRYLDKIIDQIPQAPIRIWDSSELSSESFNLTSKCVRNIAEWSKQINRKKPGSKVYFIAQVPLIYGTSRMHEIQASDEGMDVIVLKSIDELPQEMRDKILAIR